MKRQGRIAILLAVVAVFVGYLIYGSMQVTQAECALCVTFRGQTECRTGSGASEDDARAAAQRAACAVMAAGMDESIACQNTVPSQVSCPPQ